jgi:hypothetical protein
VTAESAEPDKATVKVKALLPLLPSFVETPAIVTLHSKRRSCRWFLSPQPLPGFVLVGVVVEVLVEVEVDVLVEVLVIVEVLVVVGVVVLDVIVDVLVVVGVVVVVVLVVVLAVDVEDVVVEY